MMIFIFVGIFWAGVLTGVFFLSLFAINKQRGL